MNYIFFTINIMFIIILNQLCYKIYYTFLYIKVGNSFRNFYELPDKPIICKRNSLIYKCEFIRNRNINNKCKAIIYNGNRQFPSKTNNTYNIIMTTEKLSQVKFMKDIGDGRNRFYQLAVDYRLFNNKWHVSYPIYSDYNLNEFIKIANRNFDNINSFMRRKSTVYIQRVSYYNRQTIVKEFMNYISIDSYGKDLNNKEWPKNISTKNKIDILKGYKFCIAIENSIITWNIGTKYEAPSINDDYVTEKLADCLLAGSIPIYFGPKSINLFLPHHNSIINFSSFYSIQNLTNYIKRISNNRKLIEIHTQWHYNYSKEWFNRFNNKYLFSYCKICNSIT